MVEIVVEALILAWSESEFVLVNKKVILLPGVVVFVFTKFQRDLSELDICRIYLQEYHEPIFLHFQ